MVVFDATRDITEKDKCNFKYRKLQDSHTGRNNEVLSTHRSTQSTVTPKTWPKTSFIDWYNYILGI